MDRYDRGSERVITTYLKKDVSRKIILMHCYAPKLTLREGPTCSPGESGPGG